MSFFSFFTFPHESNLKVPVLGAPAMLTSSGLQKEPWEGKLELHFWFCIASFHKPSLCDLWCWSFLSNFIKFLFLLSGKLENCFWPDSGFSLFLFFYDWMAHVRLGKNRNYLLRGEWRSCKKFSKWKFCVSIASERCKIKKNSEEKMRKSIRNVCVYKSFKNCCCAFYVSAVEKTIPW